MSDPNLEKAMAHGRAILDRFDLTRWQYRDADGTLYSMDIPWVRELHGLVCDFQIWFERRGLTPSR